MKITVDEAGRVAALKTLCGHSLLVKGAEQSMSAARYAPAVVAGRPARVTGVAIYNFAIQRCRRPRPAGAAAGGLELRADESMLGGE